MLGIIGGVGPLAGVEFQRLLVSRSDATCDQEHMPYICISQPAIPDRTASLEHNDGREFVCAMVQVAHQLTRAGVTHIVIPCNTTHARLAQIQKEVAVPIVNMVGLTLSCPAMREEGNVLVLATNGTVKAGVFHSVSLEDKLRFPNAEDQDRIHSFIYDTKKYGCTEASISLFESILQEYMRKYNSQSVILGCTELSLYNNKSVADMSYRIIDPLEILADYCIQIHQKS